MEVIAWLPMLLILLAWLWSGIWVFKDAQLRGKHPVLVGMLVLVVGWPVSILVWIALRPEIRPPPFNLDDFRIQ
jgi:hypothetical protein